MTAPPLLFVAAASGALAAHTLSVDWRAAAIVSALAAVLALVVRARLARSLLLVALVAAAPFALARHTITRHDTTTALLPGDTVVVEGIARQVAPRRAGGQRLVVDVTGFVVGAWPEDASLPGLDVSLLGAAGLVAVDPGDRVRVRGRIRPHDEASMEALFDARVHGLARGVHGRIVSGDRAAIVVVERHAESAVFARLSRTLSSRLAALVTPHEAALVAALLTGDTSGFEERDLEMYRRAGAGHLLAVSGLQVSLLALLVFVVVASALQLVPVVAWRARGTEVATGVALVSVWSYVLLCGAPPSCVRAALMATAALVAVLPGRRVHLVDTIGVAGFATLMVAPLAVVDAGFLLSYAAVIGLAWSASTEAPPVSLARRLGAVVVSSVGAGLVTLPVSAHLFGEVAPGGVVANIVLVPAASLLQVPAIVGGLAGALLDVELLVRGGAMAAGLLEALVEGMADLVGGVVLVEPPSGSATIVLVLCALVVAAGLARRALPVVVAPLTLAALVVTAPALGDEATTRVTFLPVGQGDASVVEFSSGAVWLIDGGGVWDEREDPGKEIILPWLARRGISRIDVVLLSHPDPDHLLGLLPVVETLEIGALWHAGITRAHPLIRRIEDVAQRRGVPVVVARDLLGTHDVGDTTVEVLAPRPEDGALTYSELSANDNSLVVRIARGSSSILLAGDIERWGERYLLRDHGPRLASTILKAPHHGSRTSSSEALLDAVSPTHAIFTTGRDNAFGFPHEDVVARYRARGVCLWDTAVHGRVTFVLDDPPTISTSTRAAPRCTAHGDAP